LSPNLGNLPETKLKILDKRIYSIASSIFYKKTFSRAANSEFLEKLNWLSFVERRIVYTCEYLYKHVLKESYLNNIFKTDYSFLDDGRERRKPMNFKVAVTKTKWAESSFLFQSTLMWNKLPAKIQEAKIFTEFSKEMRKHVVQRRLDPYQYN